jgi:hypothetical protein
MSQMVKDMQDRKWDRSHAELPVVTTPTSVLVQSRTADQHAETVRVRGRGVFQDRVLRDEVARLLRSKGAVCIVGSSKNLKLHPRYVYDFVGEWTKAPAEYERRWGRLYTVQLV